MKLKNTLITTAVITGAVALISGSSLAAAQTAPASTPNGIPGVEASANGQQGQRSRLRQFMKNHKGQMKNMMQNRRENHPPKMSDAAKAAITAGDFNAFKVAMTKDGKEAPILEKINATNFADFVSLVKAQETVKTLSEKLGLHPKGPQGQNQDGPVQQ